LFVPHVAIGASVDKGEKMWWLLPLLLLEVVRGEGILSVKSSLKVLGKGSLSITLVFARRSEINRVKMAKLDTNPTISAMIASDMCVAGGLA
jgi:hypothetical protein